MKIIVFCFVLGLDSFNMKMSRIWIMCECDCLVGVYVDVLW
jgi:hypothetical protein